MDSCMRGFHVYQDVWTLIIGKVLACRRETTNIEDKYAIAMYKTEEVVGHVPCKILFLFAAFIRRGGTIYCTVEGTQRYSSNLAQGDMEIPCKLTFKGPLKELQKVQKYFSSALKIQIHITNTSSNSPVTTNATLKGSSRPEKRGVDTASAECLQEKRVKCDDSESVSSSNTTVSLNSSEKSLLPKKDAPLDASSVEKEKQVVHAAVDVDTVNQLLP